MDIVTTMLEYDGRRVDPFRAVAEALHAAPEGAPAELIEIAGRADPRLQVGAAIKARIRNARRIFAALALAALALLAGCDSQPPHSETSTADTAPTDTAAPAPTPVPVTDPRLLTIESMYVDYEKKAFPDIPPVTPAEVLALLGTEQKVLIVDCREDDERAVSTIPGAVPKREFEADYQRYHSTVIIAYCTAGYRSGVFATDWRPGGLDVRNLRGGVLAWAHAGGELVDPDGRPTKRVHVYDKSWDLLPEGYDSVY